MTFLVWHNAYSAFLEKLRTVGVLHVSRLGSADAENEALSQSLATVNGIEQIIQQVQERSDAAVSAGFQCSGRKIDADSVLELYNSLVQQIQTSAQKIAQCQKDIATLEPWGDFDPSLIAKLAENGYNVGFYSTTERNWNDEWVEKYNAERIGSDSLKVYFITITGNGLVPDINADVMSCPETGLSDLKQTLKQLQAQHTDTETELNQLCVDAVEPLAEYKKKLIKELEYNQVKYRTGKEAEGHICMLRGWIPAEKTEYAQLQLQSEGVYICIEDPTPADDDIPILLNNNRFVRLFEPFTRLYMLPVYRELDLTLFIAPFFMLFFGLCFGDIGYGILMLAALPVFRKLFHLIDKNFSDGIIICLGVSTIVCGMLTGGFFGFNIYDLNIPFVKTLKEWFYMDQMKLLYAAFIIGGVHIVVSMILKAVNMTIQFGLKYAFSTIGWVLLLLGSAAAYLFPSMGFDTPVYKVIAGISLAMVFLLSSPDKPAYRSVKNLLLNIGSGLWDTYNMATGLLGDVLSYVRLFALGMSGGVLASVFDDLAVGVFSTESIWKGCLTFIGLALIFLFGHAINIFMNFLSSMIHPMRLIFVEFFKNTSYTGGGEEYKPFER